MHFQKGVSQRCTLKGNTGCQSQNKQDASVYPSEQTWQTVVNNQS